MTRLARRVAADSLCAPGKEQKVVRWIFEVDWAACAAAAEGERPVVYRRAVDRGDRRVAACHQGGKSRIGADRMARHRSSPASAASTIHCGARRSRSSNSIDQLSAPRGPTSPWRPPRRRRATSSCLVVAERKPRAHRHAREEVDLRGISPDEQRVARGRVRPQERRHVAIDHRVARDLPRKYGSAALAVQKATSGRGTADRKAARRPVRGTRETTMARGRTGEAGAEGSSAGRTAATAYAEGRGSNPRAQDEPCGGCGPVRIVRLAEPPPPGPCQDQQGGERYAPRNVRRQALTPSHPGRAPRRNDAGMPRPEAQRLGLPLVTVDQDETDQGSHQSQDESSGEPRALDVGPADGHERQRRQCRSGGLVPVEHRQAEADT